MTIGFGGPVDPAAPPASRRWHAGERIEGLDVDGRRVSAPVVDERQVRAAAALALLLGAFAIGSVLVLDAYGPLRVVAALLVVEFALRLAGGLPRAPLGWLAGRLIAGGAPRWVSAQPKRFAWSLGCAMAFAMAVMANVGIRGALPLALGTAFIGLVALEALLGICVGCELHGWLVRHGWIARDDRYEICSRGACRVERRP